VVLGAPGEEVQPDDHIAAIGWACDAVTK